jgi:sulfite reductase (NADPH) flavoprotein alpha-component
MLRRFKGGSVLIATQQAGKGQTLVVTDQSVVPIEPRDNLVKTLHEGTWAGPWSGTFNLLGAIALSLLGTTGFISWWRRRRRQRLNRSRQTAAEAAA